MASMAEDHKEPESPAEQRQRLRSLAESDPEVRRQLAESSTYFEQGEAGIPWEAIVHRPRHDASAV